MNRNAGIVAKLAAFLRIKADHAAIVVTLDDQGDGETIEVSSTSVSPSQIVRAAATLLEAVKDQPVGQCAGCNQAIERARRAFSVLDAPSSSASHHLH